MSKNYLLLLFIFANLFLFNSCSDKNILTPGNAPKVGDLENAPFRHDMKISDLSVSPGSFTYNNEKKFTEIKFQLTNLSKVIPQKGSVYFYVYFSNDNILSGDDLELGFNEVTFPIKDYNEFEKSQEFKLSDLSKINAFSSEVYGAYYIIVYAKWADDKEEGNNVTAAPIAIPFGTARFHANSLPAGNIHISIDGNPKGQITQWGLNNALYFNLPIGGHSFNAYDDDGPWSQVNFTITEGQTSGWYFY